jgi:cytochrome c biogenesis protein CcdA
MKKLLILFALLFVLIPVTIKAEEMVITTNNEEISITSKEEITSTRDDIKTLPILGEVNIKSVSLPIVAIVIGTIDGFNPCAMWVLLFLISMLLGMKDRKRMWILGVSFLFTSAFVYFLVMMAWLEIATTFSTVIWLRSLIAFVAVIGGFINIRSYIRSKDDGCEVVDQEKRTKLFDRIRKFTSEKSFILALIGVITLAVTVNVIELACSAGLPLVFTQILVVNEVSQMERLMYTLLYILFFLIDDLIVFAIAMTSLKLTGISTKYGKYSHLIGGILMIIIGLLLLLKPEWIMLNF